MHKQHASSQLTFRPEAAAKVELRLGPSDISCTLGCTRDWFAPAGTRSCRYSLRAVKKHCEAHLLGMLPGKL
eukprot:COSAG01_NODE_1627_length_9684_cov_16.787063_10_plen_72_part_00